VQSSAAPLTSALTTIRNHPAASVRWAAGLVLAASAGATGVAVAGPAHAATVSAARPDAAVLTTQSVASPPFRAHAQVLAALVAPRASARSAAGPVRGATAVVQARAAHKPATSPEELIPHGTNGPQAWMPLGHDQLANASTIVHQAIEADMGPRSAVIAVATAMQESRLVNINYGTSDSLGLFQQQPDCGWGTAQQVMNPKYATDAFLRVLREYQANDPGWAAQPLWASAQAVQKSAAPFAYARWEAQAAHLVCQFLQ
jgi:hypothetical protein